MKKIFYILSFLISCTLFSAIMPYPILGNHTNISEGVAFKINNHNETEIHQTQKLDLQLLPLSFNVMDKLLPQDCQFEVFDIKTKLSFCATRVGGNLHMDIVPFSTQDAQLLLEMVDGNWTQSRRPVLVKSSSEAFVPASLCPYPHGYNASKNFNGHLCLHFLESKMDGTKEEDYKHQKCVRYAQNHGKAFLKCLEEE